jgi:hypothetical protein
MHSPDEIVHQTLVSGASLVLRYLLHSGCLLHGCSIGLADHLPLPSPFAAGWREILAFLMIGVEIMAGVRQGSWQ